MKPDWTEKVALDIAKYDQGFTIKGDMELTADAFTRAYAEGERSYEKRESLYIARSDYGAVIPISFHIPHGIVPVIRQDTYSFTTNQDFADVLGACAKSRDANLGDDGKWIRERVQKNSMRTS